MSKSYWKQMEKLEDLAGGELNNVALMLSHAWAVLGKYNEKRINTIAARLLLSDTPKEVENWIDALGDELERDKE